FICMSDHEGFGAPLVEAMRFDLPAFARDTGAVPEIVRDAGVLLPPDTGIPIVAETIAQVVGDEERRREVVESQRWRLKNFHPPLIMHQWRGLLHSLLPD